MTSLTIAEAARRRAGRRGAPRRDARGLLHALEIDWEGFGVPEDERELRRREAREAWPRLQADGTLDAPTSRTSTASRSASAAPSSRRTAALLLGGATLPEARGHGVYTSLVHARWDEAVERGVPRLVVSAGPKSAPILERLGFEPIGRVRLLRAKVT